MLSELTYHVLLHVLFTKLGYCCLLFDVLVVIIPNVNIIGVYLAAGMGELELMNMPQAERQ
jgi:hypothetical protein